MSIKYILFFLALPVWVYSWHMPFMQPERSITIMLDPAGDSKHTGRTLDDNFERGITLQCAQQVKNIIEQQCTGVRVILTRFPGETLEPLQNASFANRLAVDCYISLHFYQESTAKPRVYMYTFSYGDDFMAQRQRLAFYPYDKAHIPALPLTQSLSALAKQAIEKTPWCTVNGAFSIPFQPLIGIQAPALAFEMGLIKKDDWPRYSQLIVQALHPIIAQLQKS